MYTFTQHDTTVIGSKKINANDNIRLANDNNQWAEAVPAAA